MLLMGAKHDVATIDNWQPLHSACKWNNTKCAALLLSRGADINASSKGGTFAFPIPRYSILNNSIQMFAKIF